MIGWVDQSASAGALAAIGEIRKPRFNGSDAVLGVVKAASLGLPPECWNLVPWLQQGVDMATQSRWEESVAAFEAAARDDPKVVRAWAGLGAGLKKLGRYQEAVAAMEQAFAANPKMSVFLYNQACYCSLAGRTEQAVECLARAVAMRPEWQVSAKTDPDFASIQRDRAFVAIVKDRERGRQLQAELDRGLKLAERGRWEEAIAVLQAFATQHPDNLDVWVAIGRCLKSMNRPGDAADAMRQSLEACGQHPRLMYNLACYGSLAGRGEEALRALMKAISLHPEYAAAADKDTDFNAIRSDPRFGVIVSRSDES